MSRHRLNALAGLMACAALLTLAPACSSSMILESRPIPTTQTQPMAGISYYLPKRLVQLSVWQYVASRPEGATGPAPRRHFVTFDGTATVPDLRHQFLIVPQWEAASHDAVQVQLTDAGLLKSVRAESEDQSGEIISNLAKLASLLIRGPAPLPTSRTRAVDLAEPGSPRLVAQYQFDPVHPKDLARVQAELIAIDRTLTVTLTKQSDCPVAGSGADCSTTCNCTSPGIYYRLPIPYRLHIAPAGVFRPPGVMGAGTRGAWDRLEGGADQTVLMPNAALCLYVPVDRRRFVTSQTAMTFDDGMLRSVTTDKPSELLGFVKIPVDVASQLLAIPSELLTIRIEQKNQEKLLAEAKAGATKTATGLLNAETELLKAMQNYQQAIAREGGTDGK